MKFLGSSIIDIHLSCSDIPPLSSSSVRSQLGFRIIYEESILKQNQTYFTNLHLFFSEKSFPHSFNLTKKWIKHQCFLSKENVYVNLIGKAETYKDKIKEKTSAIIDCKETFRSIGERIVSCQSECIPTQKGKWGFRGDESICS